MSVDATIFQEIQPDSTERKWNTCELPLSHTAWWLPKAMNTLDAELKSTFFWPTVWLAFFWAWSMFCNFYSFDVRQPHKPWLEHYTINVRNGWHTVTRNTFCIIFVMIVSDGPWTWLSLRDIRLKLALLFSPEAFGADFLTSWNILSHPSKKYEVYLVIWCCLIHCSVF